MNEHYYSEQPTSEHDVQTFELPFGGRMLLLETDAGVFAKGRLDRGTSLLLSTLPKAFEGRALDLGCGWGAVGVCMGVLWPAASIIMTDVNARAGALAAKNIAANNLAATVIQSDGFARLADSAFDLIAFNPPIRAGKAVVYRLFEESAQHLAPGGAMHVVMRKQQGADSAKKAFRALFGNVDTLARSGGYHVFRSIRQP